MSPRALTLAAALLLLVSPILAQAALVDGPARGLADGLARKAPVQPAAGGGALPATGADGHAAEARGHSHGVELPGSVRVEAAPPWTQMTNHREIQFRCPEGGVVGPVVLPVGDPTSQDRFITDGCPFRIYDTTYQFGNPQIAILNDDHREAAFFALHGPPVQGEQAATERSRGGRSHVTFTTDDQGFTWQDQPTDEGYPGENFQGESATGTMDRDGNIYVGYLWQRPWGNGTVHESTIRLFKGPTTKEPNGVVQSYGNGFPIDPRIGEGSTMPDSITRLGMVYAPRYVPPPPPIDYANTTANGTATPGNGTAPADEGEVGDVAMGEVNATDDRVVLTWFERANDWRNSTTGMPGWIDAAWTHTGADNNWTRLADAELIGPCREASNPVVVQGKVYVACVVEKGYSHRPRARIGEIDIWQINPLTGSSKFVATSYMRSGQPILAAAPDGYMILVSHQILDENTASVQFASGWFGRQWVNWGDLGPTLHLDAGSKPMRDADVTAVVVNEDPKTAFLVYKEWHERDGNAPPLDIDPADPNARLKDYRKVVMSFNECDGPVAHARMELGTGLDPYNVEAYQLNPAVYNDEFDGLVATEDPLTGEPLVYFAINDYGAMQFGAMVVESASDFCTTQAYLGPPPPPAVPQALTVANPGLVTSAAVVGVAAVAIVAYLATVKRRVPSFVTAEDK